MEPQKPENTNKMDLKPDIWFIDQLYEKVKNGIVKIPRYQRGIVWSEKQKELLIESISASYPIGAILLHESDGCYTVIDGLQRTNTIHEFLATPARYAPDALFSSGLTPAVSSSLNTAADVLEKSIRTQLEDSDIDAIGKHGLSRSLGKDVERRFGISLKPRQKEKLEEYLDEVLNGLGKFHDRVRKYRIPVLVMSGPYENLPEVFNRINVSGTKLTKYQTYSAVWESYRVRLGSGSKRKPGKMNGQIIKNVRKRYEQWEDEGLRLDFSLETIVGGELNLFEFLLGYGALLRSDFQSIIAESEEADPTTGFISFFGLFSRSTKTVMGGDFIESVLQKMHLPLDEATLYEAWMDNETSIVSGLTDAGQLLYKAYQQLDTSLGFLDRVNIKKSHSKPPQYLIATMAVWLARRIMKYPQISTPMKTAIRQRYAHDILLDKWRGTGDKQLFEGINDDRFLTAISRKEWQRVWETVRSEEEKRLHRKRMPLDAGQQLVIRLVYGSVQRIVDSKTRSPEFDDDHIFPVSRLVALYSGTGMINYIGNRSLLPHGINRGKGEMLPHEYLETTNGKKYKKDLMTYWALENHSLWTDMLRVSRLIKAAKSKTSKGKALKAYEAFISVRLDKMIEIAMELLEVN